MKNIPNTFPKELEEALQRKKQVLNLPENYTHHQVEDVFHQRATGRYLADIVFGASDGLVTTFAVVAGAAGADLAATVIIIIGAANLLGDGLSMGLGNYLGKRSEGEYEKKQHEKENWEIDNFPEIEQHEIKEIFAHWGFQGQALDNAVATVCSNREIWIEIMMKEELGIFKDDDYHPAKHGLATFIAFALAGFVPLLPFLFGYAGMFAFTASMVLTGLTMFFTGAFRSKISTITFWKGGLEMLAVGAIASGSAYLIGVVLSRILE
ncbi:MAG: VIT1/CCC1 transporter family protein [Candidatus Nomurabacteria bacterium]|nr:MAG: VIT1/CCC1 transporter family protein [Candidatus Nomurabacteria bacterium]